MERRTGAADTDGRIQIPASRPARPIAGIASQKSHERRRTIGATWRGATSASSGERVVNLQTSVSDVVKALLRIALETPAQDVANR